MKRLLLAVALLALAAGLHPASAQHAVLPGWDAASPDMAAVLNLALAHRERRLLPLRAGRP